MYPGVMGCMIFHPIAAFFAFSACILGFCTAETRLPSTVVSICTTLAMIMTVLALILDFTAWGTVKKALTVKEEFVVNGNFARYGNANCDHFYFCGDTASNITCRARINCPLGITRWTMHRWLRTSLALPALSYTPKGHSRRERARNP